MKFKWIWILFRVKKILDISIWIYYVRIKFTVVSWCNFKFYVYNGIYFSMSEYINSHLDWAISSSRQAGPMAGHLFGWKRVTLSHTCGQLDSFTVPLFGHYHRNLLRDFQWLPNNSKNSNRLHEPIMHCGLLINQCRWGIPQIYI